jgi:ribonuclease HI
VRLLIHTDGAARGNPGPAGAGAVLRDSDGMVVVEIAKALGRATNNVAEWTAVLLALEEARRLGATHVDLRMDSELVARQISGIYKVKHPDLKPLHADVMELLRSFEGYTVGHIPRALNADADRLSNVAIDATREADVADTFEPPLPSRDVPGRGPTGDSKAE